MTLATARPRPGPLIGPLARPGVGARSVAGVILILLAALGALAAILAGATIRQDWGLRDRLADPVTVALWASGLESADAAAGRATEILTKVGGVKSVRTLDPTPQDAGIARLMGAAPHPGAEVRLLVLEPAANPAAVAGAAARALAAGSIPARVDDHTWPGSPTLKTLAIAAGAGVLVFGLLKLLTAAACGWITRREIAARAGEVDLLRLSGAGEAFIGRLFVRRTLRLAFWAACLGAALAAALAGLWVRFGQGLAVTPPAALAHIDLAWSGVWILAVTLIAWMAAALAARAELRPRR